MTLQEIKLVIRPVLACPGHVAYLVHQHRIVDPGVVHRVSDGANYQIISPATTGLVLQTSEQRGEAQRRISNEEQKYRQSQ